MSKDAMIMIAFAVLMLIEVYAYQAVKFAFKSFSKRKMVQAAYWVWSALVLAGCVYMFANGQETMSRILKTVILSMFIVNIVSKLVLIIFNFLDDFRRLGLWIFRNNIQKKTTPQVVEENTEIKEAPTSDKISRSEFLTKASLLAASVPAASFSFGILSGAYDYRVRTKSIVINDLPRALDGIRIAQLSDIHTGSFYNKVAVQGGVDLLLKEKPDLVCFTGDLVNTVTKEVNEYFDVFKNVKAPLGVYSVLGNHDYGDYKTWSSAKAKQSNFEDMVDAHKHLGWDLLRNENRQIKVGNDHLDIIGVENWGHGFAQYGKLSDAYSHLETGTAKVLLSHDPSHWDAEVRQDFKDIDLTLSGHTHGFQFGIEIGDFRWSPAQYRYAQWADLYEKQGQSLYVNRGFGFHGYPGRLGILPEITILELKSAKA
ncbi:metallophosphoesterase [Aureibacter tunicatorum]|uniref:Calcineurin-like phosphoesterase domain-containing protein n=1 Tax=Aureibacter tunicatorum TaxID=866807 RepID=A0AAE3XKP3_9BACT|nr:metallophosphoesterase [Aureibacter tunicatorum]MDR6238295.1 hypothetical protein [Aureibacter tunicatorum]